MDKTTARLIAGSAFAAIALIVLALSLPVRQWRTGEPPNPPLSVTPGSERIQGRIALGPLTNVARAIEEDPGLARKVTRIIAVMGKRKDHLFHPTEARGWGAFFGHGPVFRDFNHALDPRAAKTVIEAGIPMTFVPYEAARDVMITAADLERIAASAEIGAWMAVRTRGWLDYWKDDVGIAGFYPFDVMAAAYAIDPGALECARVKAWIRQPWPLARLFGLPDALEVGLESEVPGHVAPAAEVTYCPRARTGIHEWLIGRLGG